jgi:long-chain acyl-CoA synthetase
MEFRRLFDALYCQQELYPNATALAEKAGNKWVYYSTEECLKAINSISKALYAMGIREGDKVGMIAPNRPAWNFIDMGVTQLGAVLVPVYTNINDEEYSFIFKDSAVKMAFVGDKAMYSKIDGMRSDLPALQEIFTFNQHEGLPHWKDILPKGETISDELIQGLKDMVREEQLATIIYTSGTTGTPKGVMLSHKNIVSNVKSSLQVIPLKPGERTVSFLPICHIFERTVTYLCMYRGASIHYIERMETLGDNLKEVKPHFFSTVPRIMEKLFEKIVSKGEEQKGIKKKLFFWALRLAEKYGTSASENPLYKLQLSIADKLIFSKWRMATGGCLFGIVSGAAALQPRLARVFSAAGIPVKQGYGQTESSPVVAVNRFYKEGGRFGTVGPPIPDVLVKIAKDGEILVKGDNVMMGYYKRPDLTAETIDSEGWLHTGDVGEMREGFLAITDRKKELFKTSGGKYIAPQVIENKFKESFMIGEIMIIGENRKTISAMIVPNFTALRSWCEENKIHFSSKEEITTHPLVVKHYGTIRDGFNKQFSDVEKVKKITLLPDEWTIEKGEITPTLKLKRKFIMEKYAAVVADLYNE